LPLLEKAYAQWNETGKSGQNGTNSYAGISGGWMADVLSQALGYSVPSIWNLAGSTKQTVINSIAKNQAVTIGTSQSLYGLYGDHAYTIVGYNSTSDTFTLYNPWGSSQPGPLTWTQLQAACDGLAIADPTIAPGTTTTFTVSAAWFLLKGEAAGGDSGSDAGAVSGSASVVADTSVSDGDTTPAAEATINAATVSNAISAVLSDTVCTDDDILDTIYTSRAPTRSRKGNGSAGSIAPAAVDATVSA